MLHQLVYLLYTLKKGRVPAFLDSCLLGHEEGLYNFISQACAGRSLQVTTATLAVLHETICILQNMQSADGQNTCTNAMLMIWLLSAVI